MQLRKGRKRKKGCGRLRVFPCQESADTPAHRAPHYNDDVRFQLRPFEPADFETLWQIDQACFDPQLAYSQAEMAFYMRRPGSFTLVAEAENKTEDHRHPAKANSESLPGIAGSRILGFIIAESRRRTGHIITIDVVDEARRAGVGSALLLAAEEKLLHAGATAVALETPVNNAAAIRFYKHEGYFIEKTVSGYYSNQMDALVMTKNLASGP
jgi:ribosomal-protein-alanine N-acetyltransferase